MVFHNRPSAGDYEVGILDHRPCHTFTIKKDGTPVKSQAELDDLQRQGNLWRLHVKNVKTGISLKGIEPVEVGHDTTRLTDDDKGKFDFSWIPDFESAEFHAGNIRPGEHELCLQPGLLKPIVRLSSGKLYTRHKIEKLKRLRKNVLGEIVSSATFGFMTETVALDVFLGPGEALVLQVDNGGHGNEVFRVIYGEPVAEICFENTRDNDKFCHPHRKRQAGKRRKAKREPSHFPLYYTLFPCITEQYDIDLDCKPAERPCHVELPKNPHPVAQELTRTVGAYPCGAISLGTRQSDLV